jgi:hypothetical protein
MKLMVLPISGIHWVTQCAMIKQLCKCGFKPDLSVGSSGGNIAQYVALAGNWNSYSITRVVSQIKSSMFSKKWFPLTFISNMIGFFKKTLYNSGEGSEEFFEEIFTEESIKKNELWTGLYNENDQKSSLFCNISSEESVLDIKDLNLEISQSTLPIFCNGNIKLIARVCLGSAAIPGMIKSVSNINDKSYVDGGVGNASPLIVLKNAINQRVKKTGEELHIFYLNSFNFNETATNKGLNLLDTLTQAGSNLVRSHTSIDRMSAYELIQMNCDTEIKKIEFICNQDNIKKILEIQKKLKCSLTEFYPDNYAMLDIINFESNELVEKIEEMESKCNCRFWFPTSEFDDEINFMFKN